MNADAGQVFVVCVLRPKGGVEFLRDAVHHHIKHRQAVFLGGMGCRNSSLCRQLNHRATPHDVKAGVALGGIYSGA